MAAQLARAGLFAIISYLAQSAFHRGKTLGAVRLALGTQANFHPSAEDVKIIPDTINCEDLHVHNGLIFAACQEKDGTRKGWFPALHNFNDPSQAVYGNLRIIDPEVSRGELRLRETASTQETPDRSQLRDRNVQQLIADRHRHPAQDRGLRQPPLHDARHRRHRRPGQPRRRLHPRREPRPERQPRRPCC